MCNGMGGGVDRVRLLTVWWYRMSQKYYYAWRTWSVDVPVEYEGWLEFCVRTWDNALNTEPTFTRSTW